MEKKSEKDILTSNALISLISEMVGRVFKRGWYAAVRNEGHDEQWRKQQTISFFKLMFPTQISEDAKNEWNKALKSTLINEFILSDSFVDKFISKITSSELFPILLQKVCLSSIHFQIFLFSYFFIHRFWNVLVNCVEFLLMDSIQIQDNGKM